MDRADTGQLADFLRTRRARLQPPDVGLPTGQRRRTPGLRREEVAVLAAMSTDYYTRLEQGRGPRPSRQVLTGLARALRLSDDERAHLFHLAGEQPERPGRPSADVRPGILRMIERLDDTPAMVLDAKYDVLAWNPLAAALICDFSAMPARDRNLVRQRFLSGMSCRYSSADTEQFAREVVADVRAATARYPEDPGVRTLVADLLAGSAEFRTLWADHEVRVQRSLCKTVHHPQVGRVDLICEFMLIPDRDQRVVLYTAEPGTASYDALQLLKVIGTQDLTPTTR